MIPTTHVTRRDLLLLSGTALAASVLKSRSAAGSDDASRTIAGRVIDETTGRGLPGIRVSNGRAISLTDDDGHYRLQVREGDLVFVVKPADFMVSIDRQTMLPHFYHATDNTGGTHDFMLRPQREERNFEVLMFADPQPSDMQEVGFIREQVVSALANTRAAFGLTLGDVVGDELSLYDRYNRVVAQVGVPWWNLPGNHDLDRDAPQISGTRNTWKRTFGPPTYAFDYGATTFVMIDNVDWRGRDARPHPYVGNIGPDNLAFIAALLETVPQDRLIVLCMHIPLVSAADPADPASNTGDRDALLALIGTRPCVSFSGHMHTTEHHYIPLPDGGSHHHHVLTAVSGSWWSGPLDARGVPLAQSMDGTPNGWHVLEIEGAQYSTRFVSAREPAQMRIMLAGSQHLREDSASSLFLAGPIRQSLLGETQIFVNIFDGGPRTQVDCCVTHCSPTRMLRRSERDPMTQELFLRAGKTLKPWVQAEPSSHMWIAPLPDHLAPGVHRLDVTADGEFGVKQNGALVFEVVAG